MSVTVTRVNNLLAVSPLSFASVLIPVLTWQRQERNPQGGKASRSGGERQAYFHTVDEPLYNLTPNELITYVGFRDRIFETLSKYTDVNYVDTRTVKALPTPNMESLGVFRYKQDVALAAIWNSEFGVIDGATGFGKTELTAKVVLSYPQLKIAIVAPDKATLLTISQRLKEYGIDAGMVDGSTNKRRQVTLVSALSLPKLDDNGDLKKIDLLLFDEVHRSAAPTTRMGLARAINARFFGFTGSADGRSDKGEIVIEGMFGRPVCKVSYQEAEAHGLVVPITVLMVDTPGEEMETGDMHRKERDLIWRNAGRNNLFAWMAQQLLPMGQTLLLTDKLEHAANIRRLMPEGGWPLVYGTHPANRLKKEMEEHAEKTQAKGGGTFARRSRRLVSAENLVETLKMLGYTRALKDSERETLQDDFKAAKIPGAIATKVWSTGVDFPKLQFMIRADGTSSKILSTQMGGRASRISTEKHVGIIIDGDDQFDKTFRRRAEERARIYRGLGWTVIRKVPPLEAISRCRALLASQPTTLMSSSQPIRQDLFTG